MKNDSAAASEKLKRPNGKAGLTEGNQVVLVFQGGGALGAYQAGVYEGLHEAGIEPDWIVGTSIGAINAALIAGNQPGVRVARLAEFWDRVAQDSFRGAGPVWPQLSRSMAYLSAVWNGIPSFFAPNPLAFIGQQVRLGPERAGYYSTKQLMDTLEDLVDFRLINRCRPRLTVGAAHVRSSRMRYFDGRDMEIGVEHILASGALPPAFPAVRINGELYWDGGILSNTPSEVVFDDNPRRSSLIFSVHLWNPEGEEPSTIWQVLHRHKDIQYSSRVANHILRQQQAHRLRHVIQKLASELPADVRGRSQIRELESWGCSTQMHIVRLLAPSLEGDDQNKDVDFSTEGIAARWKAGLEDARKAVARAPWIGDFDPLEGVFLHQPPWAGKMTMDAEKMTSLTRTDDPTLEKVF
jgi:NTE family protein